MYKDPRIDYEFYRDVSSPSKMSSAFERVIGCSITKLVRCSDCTPEELVRDYHVNYSQVFSFTEGPIIVYLSSGDVIVIGSGDESWSLDISWVPVEEVGESVLLREILNDGWVVISCEDTELCEEWVRELLGRKICAIDMLKWNPTDEQFDAYLVRLREVGLVFRFEGEKCLILAHSLAKAPNPLNVIRPDQVVDRYVGTLETVKLA
ncbi:hypothetical protein Plim_1445 [Planctopirus limnophila DSM 3776]|uniref:Uncharacterized protein n=1 Tax=Planctopirus limnophila (strain ATCC 43296 / DSM 3776 / IFAM 1008 / Mu 290) TaxID=521674 RepID=D5SVZ4_PLAL2|nr:hypothetical protein [Planctopirus limnophila]ADG67279.1 hypothetical protein Plim_1445 [Planctopirus limnophila DSM 3776]